MTKTTTHGSSKWMDGRWYVRLGPGEYKPHPIIPDALASYRSEPWARVYEGDDVELVEGPKGATPHKLEKLRRIAD